MRHLAFIVFFAVGFSYAQPVPYVSRPVTGVGDSINGKREGWWKFYEYIEFPKFSSLKTEGSYKNNQRQGEWNEYYRDGKIKGIGNYFNDEKHGKWSYYDSYGTIYKTENYQNGKLHGEFLMYHNRYNADEKLRLCQEGICIDGKKEGEWKTYDRNGNITALEMYANGKRHGENKAYDKGILKNVVPYKEGREHGTATWFYTTEEYRGNVQDIIHFVNGKEEGESKSFWENGQLEKIEYYQNGRKEGAYKKFYRNGQLRETGTYHRGKKIGEWKFFYENGRLEEIGMYKDGKHGKWKYFNMDGDLYRVEVYENGKLIKKKEKK